MPAPATIVAALATFTVVVALLVMLATAMVVPPVVGRPISKMLSSAVRPVVDATVNVRSAELATAVVR